MKKSLVFAAALLVTSGAASAEPRCTSEPKDKWISESDMKAKIASLGYQAKVFKVTKGNCYEIYGFDKGGKRVEIYFNPVTGNIVEQHKT
jgi:hypothetical protein